MILAYLLTSIILSSAFAEEPVCDFNMYWGHGTKIRTDVKSDIENKKVCVVGQGCYLENESGDILGIKESIGFNGDWMSDIEDRRYNGGLNPKNVNLVEQERESISEVNAVGFFNLTEHNWTMLLLNSMINAMTETESNSKKCSKVKIKFICNHDEDQKKDQKIWDARIKRATGTALKTNNGKSIKTKLKQCAVVTNLLTQEKVAVYNVPKKCGEEYEFGAIQLEKIYNGCSSHFNKYAASNYRDLSDLFETKPAQMINVHQRQRSPTHIKETKPKTPAHSPAGSKEE
jgi:hypothetical protein